MGTIYRRKAGGNYHGEFTDASGRRVRKSTGTTNKQDASRIVARWEAKANSLRHGIGDAAELLLEDLVAEYLDYLGNASDKHRDHTQRRLARMLDPHGWTRPQQITQYEIETTVRNLRDEKTGRPLATRTRSHYLAAAKSFTRWLSTVRRALVVDPLAAVKKPNWEADRKRVRRFLLPDEWFWLSRTEYAVLYETAIQTGFRASEVLALQPAHLGKDHLFLPAKHTKNGQDATQYITASLRERLTKELPFQVPDFQRLAKLLRRDLEVARLLHLDQGPSNRPAGFLQPKDARGAVLDFHALRHTCGAWLALSNVQPKVIQSVMRHSSIALTLDTYGHLLPGAERDIVQHFDRLMSVDL